MFKKTYTKPIPAGAQIVTRDGKPHAKFKGKGDAEKMLVAQLKDGKGHPAVKASEGDIATMVKFVLAQ